MNIMEKEIQNIAIMLSKKNILQTKLDIESSETYYKTLNQICVYNYCKRNKNEKVINKYLKTKGLKISNSTNLLMIGWNKDNIYFLKE